MFTRDTIPLNTQEIFLNFININKNISNFTLFAAVNKFSLQQGPRYAADIL